MATCAPFIPVHPRRTRDWVPTWRGFFGERLRNGIYGWPEPAFDGFHKRRDMLGLGIHLISDPDAVEHVLLSHKENYIRPGLVQRILSPLVGNGLLSAEGEDWRQQRKIVAPTFAPGAVTKMSEIFAQAALEQASRWEKSPTRIDMAKEATDATMAIICRSLFANDARLASGDASKHIDNLIIAGGQARLSTIFGIQDFDPSPVMVRARKGRVYLRETLTKLVRERGALGGGDDFFGGLIRSLYEHFPADIAESLAVDNAITFYVAGHETTANALAWTIYLLAAQPALQEEARAEVLAALTGDVSALADRLPLLRMILEESMRLYPPAPRFDREAVADDQIGDLQIKKGELMSIWPWVIHRHRKLWTNPDAFDHTRFSPEKKAGMHRFQYIPFGAGPRVCVGMRFAVTEALVILAHWLAARRFEIPPGFQPDPVSSVTLRPRGGMPLIVRPL
jgi:cytochrome P450